MPYERVILLGFAIWRAVFTYGVGVLVAYTAYVGLLGAHSVVVALGIGALAAVGAAWLSADGIEHLAKQPLLKTRYNPYVMAIGEWEGWMGPTTSQPAMLAVWRAQMCKPQPPQCPWWGDVTSFCG